jgi:hypothetical protein
MGILRLPGDEPDWIWAFTCPTRNCSCRGVLVLATSGDRETLMARGASVGEAWSRGSDHVETAASLSGVTVFQLDLDSGEVGLLQSEKRFNPDDLAAHPELSRVVDRIDGEVLDAIGRLWYLGKGDQDPEEVRRAASKIELVNWTAGDLVAWDEVAGIREDLYVLDDRVYGANALYCVNSGCTCGETVISFSEGPTRDARHVGRVRVARSGTEEIELENERQRAQLERLWGAFRNRYPHHRERFARRAAVMQELGPKIVSSGRSQKRNAPVVAAAKLGRNEPCPCGSGKKHKKCCGAA